MKITEVEITRTKINSFKKSLSPGENVDKVIEELKNKFN